MRLIRYVLCVFILLMSFQALADYAIFMGVSESAGFYVFRMNGNGILDLNPDAYTFDADFADPVDVTVSRTGRFIAMNDFTATTGIIYEIDNYLKFHFIQRLYCNVGGLGFTRDEKYFFISTDFNHYPPPKLSSLALYEWNDTSFTLASTESISSTATLSFRCSVSSKDEIFGSTFNGYLNTLAGVSIYKLDRTNNQFDLQQYYNSLVSGVDYTALSSDENVLFFGGRQNYQIYKGEYETINVVGMMKRNSQWDITDVQDKLDGFRIQAVMDVAFLRNKPLCVVMAGGYASTESGPHLFYCSPDGKLQHLSNYALDEAKLMAVTPDGKYIAAAWNYGSNISIIRINPETGALTETQRIHGPVAGCMTFLPQAFPPAAANDACVLYDSTGSAISPERNPMASVAVAKALRKKTKISSYGAKDNPIESTWRQVEINERK